jgi:hypothetical protein
MLPGGVTGMSFSLGQRVATVLGGALVVAGAFVMPKFWRGEYRELFDRGSSGWWPFGEPLRKAFIRGILLGGLGMTCAVLAAVCVWVRGDTEGDIRTVANAGITIFGLMLMLLIFLSVLVILFNRPKFLIPPTYREEPGAIRYWIDLRRKKRG